jgi:hypothetical protein
MNISEKSNDNLKDKSLEVVFVYLNKMKGEARKETRFDYMDSIISVTGVFLAVCLICF